MAKDSPLRELGKHTVNINFIVNIKPVQSELDDTGRLIKTWQMELSNGDIYTFTSEEHHIRDWLEGIYNFLDLIGFHDAKS